MSRKTRVSLSALTACCITRKPGMRRRREQTAYVSIQNDFNDPDMATCQPPSTICRSQHLGVDFGQIGLGEMSAEKPVEGLIDHVLTVAAWKSDLRSSPLPPDRQRRGDFARAAPDGGDRPQQPPGTPPARRGRTHPAGALRPDPEPVARVLPRAGVTAPRVQNVSVWRTTVSDSAGSW